jgi:cyclopropane fatty-acyl-phospholipid synthase-like methyltransferase
VHHVLDIGAGIGGAGRYVAQTYGSIVTGIDLTAEYCDVANLLAQRVGLASRVSVRHASALDLPFAPWT